MERLTNRDPSATADRADLSVALRAS
ncbi:hypothetical protein [Streptosporangium sp. NPDC003464]